jgi:predicted RNA-binding Zn-ribbon protein involved in translation (DUF1610 family)
VLKYVKLLLCPSCGSGDIHRSRTRSPWENLRKSLTTKRLYRCQRCGFRGWTRDSGPRLDEAMRDRAERALAETDSQRIQEPVDRDLGNRAASSSHDAVE